VIWKNTNSTPADKWSEGQVSIASQEAMSYKDMFRVIRGTMQQTDFIALDEIEVRHTPSCHTIPTEATPVPDPCKLTDLM
jgi:hypothetical protein